MARMTHLVLCCIGCLLCFLHKFDTAWRLLADFWVQAGDSWKIDSSSNLGLALER